jgi:hypothetical protein
MVKRRRDKTYAVVWKDITAFVYCSYNRRFWQNWRTDIGGASMNE